jgi:hypothetical protein
VVARFLAGVEAPDPEPRGLLEKGISLSLAVLERWSKSHTSVGCWELSVAVCRSERCQRLQAIVEVEGGKA